MPISAKYIELNRELHERNEHYGSKGDKWATKVDTIAERFHVKSICDVGCGKGTLGNVLSSKYQWFDYDPAVKGKETPPTYAEMIVCTDVIEHIEPEHLENFLTFLQGKCLRICFLTVSTRAAHKTLDDGRNAHLTIEPIEWWLPQLTKRFRMLSLEANTSEFEFTGASKCAFI